MLRKYQGDVEWLEFELFQEIPDLVHGVFLRHGGISTGAFTSLNVGEQPGEKGESVLYNLEKVRGILDLGAFASGVQCHGREIADVESSLRAIFPSCDGLITRAENVGLLIKHADCQAALFVDPVERVIGNVHAGWRGNIQNIYAYAVELLEGKGCKRENLLVGIGPSLGPDAAEFINHREEFPSGFSEFEWRENYFNLWELGRSQLIKAGVLSHHIEVASICTYAHPEDFFSYRRAPVCGRHATVIGFK